MTKLWNFTRNFAQKCSPVNKRQINFHNFTDTGSYTAPPLSYLLKYFPSLTFLIFLTSILAASCGNTSLMEGSLLRSMINQKNAKSTSLFRSIIKIEMKDIFAVINEKLVLKLQWCIPSNYFIFVRTTLFSDLSQSFRHTHTETHKLNSTCKFDPK